MSNGCGSFPDHEEQSACIPIPPGARLERSDDCIPMPADLQLKIFSSLAVSLQREINDIGPKIVAMLNQAYQHDPGAMHRLMHFHTSCNYELAKNPYVIVEEEHFDGMFMFAPAYCVGALGLINGIMIALDRDDVVAAVFDDEACDDDGRNQLVGFKLVPRTDPAFLAKKKAE